MSNAGQMHAMQELKFLAGTFSAFEIVAVKRRQAKLLQERKAAQDAKRTTEGGSPA